MSFEAQLMVGMKKAKPVVASILRWHLQDVEDVLQMAALLAIKHRNTFEERSAFSTWFTKIAINQALMHLRKMNKPVVSLDGYEEVLAENSSNPERLAIRKEILEKSFDIFTERVKRTMELYYLYGYKIREITELLGLKESSVKSYCFRGRTKVRKWLLEQERMRIV